MKAQETARRAGGRSTVLSVGAALCLLLAACSGQSGSATPQTSAGTATSPSSAVSSPPVSSPVVSSPAVSAAPVSTAPASSEPVSSEPASSEPVSSEPVSSEPVSSEPVSSEPVASTTPGSVTESLPAITVDTTNADAKSALKVINAALLTPAEIATGFTKVAYTPPDPKDTSHPLACGGVSTAALFPNALRTGTTLVKGDSVQFQESVALYVDDAAAAGALASSIAGLDCRKGSIDGSPVTISAPQDVTSEVGGQKAVAWSVDIQGDKGVLIAVGSGSLVVGYTFFSAAGTNTDTLPAPLTLAKKATAKLLASGLG